MAHIFISYASEDRARAKEVAIDLQALGWEVWWDRELQAGKTFAGVIESEIKRAGCVLVLWSKASVASRWVRDEANEGLARDVLVPALIERVEPPMGFRSIHAADLIDYHGDQNAPGFRKLVADLTALIGPPPRRAQPDPAPAPPRPAPPPSDGGWLRRRWPLAAGAVAAALLAAWGIARYVADVERRAADLEGRQRAFEEKSRRAAEEAAQRQAAEAEASRRAAEKALQAAAAAEKERQSALENERLAAAERQRAADADAARKADAERARAAADAAARKAEEDRRRLAAAAKSPAKPPPAVEVKPDPRVTEPPARVEASVPQPPPAGARSPLVPVPGDTWSYRYVDGFRRGEVDRLIYRVEGVGAAGIDETLRVQKRPDYSSRITVPREPRFVGHAGLEYAPPDFAPYLQAFQALEQGASLPAVKRVFTSEPRSR